METDPRRWIGALRASHNAFLRQVSALSPWDRRSVSVLQALDDRDLSSLQIPFLGRDVDVATFAGFRLSEHAIHSWDLAVTFDPAAEVLESSVHLLVDRLGFMVERLGKTPASGAHRRIGVRTTNPERRFLLAIKDKASLSEEPAGDEKAEGRLTLPAAAFIRLVYGRLDPDHTPAEVKIEGEADLEELRQVFPGF